MIWAATGDLVNRFTPQAFGNINLGCALTSLDLTNY